MENKWPKSVKKLVESLMSYLESIEDEEIKAQTAEIIIGLSVPIVRVGLKRKEMIKLINLPIGVSFNQKVLRTLTDLSSNKYSLEQLSDTMQEEYDKIKEQKMTDEDIIRPTHYQSYYKDGVDCLTAMEHAWGKTCVAHFALGNALKYIWRHSSKGQMQDIDKAIEYLNIYKKLNIIDLGQ